MERNRRATEQVRELRGPGAAATTSASVARGGIWSVTANLAPQLFALAVSIAGARFLGPSGLGRQSFIAFAIASLQNLFALGLPIALMRFAGESLGAARPGEIRGLMVHSWRFISVGAAGAFGVLLGVGLAGAEPRAAWIVAAVTAAAGVITAIPGAVLAALQRWRDLAYVIVASNAAGALITIAVLALGGGVTGMIAVQLGVALTILVAVGELARRQLAVVAPVAANPGIRRRMMVRYAGVSLVGSLITLIVFRRSEFLLLAHYANDREIALYSVAFGSVAMLALVPQGLAVVVSPAVATLLGAGADQRIRVGYSRALRLLLLAAMPVTALALALGPMTLRVLFGSEFGGTRIPLLVLLLPLPLIPLMNISYSLVIGLGKARFPLIVGFGSAVLNIALDFALIPRHGAVGAAVANSCAQGATALATIAYGTRLAGPVRWDASTLVRALAGSVAAGATAWFVGQPLGGVVGLVAGVLAGAAIFAGVGATLKIIPHDDAGWLESTFGPRIGLVTRRFGRKA